MHDRTHARIQHSMRCFHKTWIVVKIYSYPLLSPEGSSRVNRLDTADFICASEPRIRESQPRLESPELARATAPTSGMKFGAQIRFL